MTITERIFITFFFISIVSEKIFFRQIYFIYSFSISHFTSSKIHLNIGKKKRERNLYFILKSVLAVVTHHQIVICSPYRASKRWPVITHAAVSVHFFMLKEPRKENDLMTSHFLIARYQPLIPAITMLATKRDEAHENVLTDVNRKN